MSQYRQCRYSYKKEYCVCSLYIRVNNTNPHFAFIDFCKMENETAHALQFRHFQRPNSSYYPNLDCNTRIRDPNNDQEWNNVPVSFTYFKCAKLVSSCNNYVVKFK